MTEPYSEGQDIMTSSYGNNYWKNLNNKNNSMMNTKEPNTDFNNTPEKQKFRKKYNLQIVKE